MIRKAKVADLPALMELGRRLHEISPYKKVPIDLQTCAGTLGHCISSAFGFAMVAEKDGKITGLLMGAAVPLWFSRRRSASDIVTYAESAGDGYRLIKAFLKWAWSVPLVVEVTMAQGSGIDTERTAVLYERAGLTRLGNIYTAVRQEQIAEAAA